MKLWSVSMSLCYFLFSRWLFFFFSTLPGVGKSLLKQLLNLEHQSLYNWIKPGKSLRTKVSTVVYVKRRFTVICCIEQPCWIEYSILHLWQAKRNHMLALILSLHKKQRLLYLQHIRESSSQRELGKKVRSNMFLSLSYIILNIPSFSFFPFICSPGQLHGIYSS